MRRHLEIAQSFVQEQLQQRQGIVGVLLVGSVAYGEETAFSDIDLRLIVQVEPGTELDRTGIDGWRDGVYMDALPVERADYADLEKILDHSIRANDLNSGLILYDPTGFLAEMQSATRAVFMAPERVAQRLQHLLERGPQNIRNLQQAIETHDSIRICIFTGRLVFGMALIPLIHQGIAPSSVRHLAKR
jgi:predicted nucleotidyltransferase